MSDPAPVRRAGDGWHRGARNLETYTRLPPWCRGEVTTTLEELFQSYAGWDFFISDAAGRD